MSLSGLSGYLDIPNANLRVAGAVQTGTINVGSARIFATYDLDVVTAKGNTTPYTIGFSNPTTGLATTSNAQIGGNLTVSSNLTVGGSVSSNLELASNLILNEDLFLVGNTQIRNNSNVVTEFTGPHGRPQATLTKFPEIQMTEKAKAGYVVSASSSLSNNSPHYAFDNDIGATSGEVYSWQSGAVNYDTSGGGWLGGTGAAYSTTVGGTTYYGEWIQLKLPVSIDLSHVDIYPQTHASVDLTGRTPQTGKLVGSTNGTTWVLLKDFTLTQPPETGYARIDVATANYYTYFRLVAETTFGGVYGNYTGFAEMKLFGTPQVETAGDISQDTTLKSIYNTPSNLDANVYLDGDLGATLTNQISGGPALTGTGATYDSAGKYWSLDGSTESNVVTGDLAFQGDQPHSVSLWFNSSNLEANVANSTIYHIGTAAATGDATHRVYLGNKNLVWNYGKDTELPLKANTWHHLTHTYEGVGGYRTLYLDGRKVESAYAGDTAGDYPPFGMTGYSQGGYTVTASQESGSYEVWGVFNDTSGVWLTGAGEYPSGVYDSSVTGLYNLGTLIGGGSTDDGHYLKLELPHKLKISHVNMHARTNYESQAPKNFKFYGSNDDTNWEQFGPSFSNEAPQDDGTSYYTLNSIKAYKFIGLVVTETVGDGNGRLSIEELKFYGHKENDLIRFPDATNVRKYPDTAMVSNGPQRGYTVSASAAESASQPWEAFDESVATNTSGWIWNTSGTHNLGTDSGSGTATDGGHWIRLELPHKLVVNRVDVISDAQNPQGQDQFPDEYAIYGWNGSGTWTKLLDVTGKNPTLGTSTTFSDTISNSTAYKHIALVAKSYYDNSTSFGRIAGIKYYGTQESTPVLARLGGSFEGKVANFRVYNKCIKEDQALELWDAQKDQFGLAKSSVTVYKGRVGIGTTEPQAALTVADEVALPPKSGEFPPGPMTNYETHFKDHGLFRASASSEYNTTSFSAWRAFDREWDNNDCWASGNATVTTGTGLPSSTAVNFQGTLGNWLQLELPYKIYLNQFKFESRIDGNAPEELPGSGIVYGSNDEVNWDVVHSFSGVNYGGATGTIRPLFTVNSTTSYSIYRLLVTANYIPQTDFTAIGEWRLFGTPETTTKYSTLHDGELTLTKSLNVPRIGPALALDLVPRRDALEIEFDTSRNIHHGQGGGSLVVNTAGGNNGPHGSFSYGSKYDSNTRAFAFDEADDHISLTRTGAQGNFIHSVSAWVNSRDLNDVETIVYFGNFTNTSTGQVASYQIYNDKLQNGFWENTHDFAYTFVNNTWYHVVWTYNGDGSNGRRAYVNGIEIAKTATSGTYVNNNLNLTGSGFALGGNVYNGAVDWELNGYISGFRLYNIALDQGDILKLYEMGRNGPANYINMVDTSLAIGRHAPTAALDVEGKVKAGGAVTNFTGQHRCVPEGPMEPGLIVSADKNRYVNMKDGLKTGSKAITIDESLPVVALSNVSQDKSCFGVVSSVEGVGTSRSETKGGFISETPKVLGDNRAIVNSLGEGALWVVNTGGPLESGDYVTTSNVAGYGQRQDDDVLHNYTVAKITMDCDFTASNVATQAPKKVETLVTVEEGVWSNLSAYNRSSETQTQYINGENVVLTEGEWSNLATEEQNTYSDTTITTYYEIRRGENLLDENGNIQWEDTDGVEPGYKVRFLTSDGTQTDEANAVHIAAFVGCTYHCG
jgi:hypothetical protein